MPAHRYHDDLPGYNANAVLQDGCPVCEERTTLPRMLDLDPVNLYRLWERVRTRKEAPSKADAEAQQTLYHVAVLVERLGIDRPFDRS